MSELYGEGDGDDPTENEGLGDTVDLQAAIAKELAEGHLVKPSSRLVHIPVDIECLLFLRTPKNASPADIVVKAVDSLLRNRAARTRYVRAW